MTESYSKDELLLTGVRKILVDDNTNTGKEVREIHFYVSDNIFRGNLNQDVGFPQITMDVEGQNSDINLPSQHFIFVIRIHINKETPNANTILGRIGARVEFLLNKKVSAINVAADLSKNLRCRMFNKNSSINSTDYIMDVTTKTIMFRVIIDDEVV